MSASPPRRPCVCKGPPIEPLGNGERSITEAVTDHNATDAHQAWRYRGLMTGDLAIPETPAETVRRNLAADPLPAGAGVPIPTPTVRRVDVEPELTRAGRLAPWDGKL